MADVHPSKADLKFMGTEHMQESNLPILPAWMKVVRLIGGVL